MENKSLKYEYILQPLCQFTMEKASESVGKILGVAIIFYDGYDIINGPHTEYYSNMKPEVLEQVLKMVHHSVDINLQPLPILGSC